MARVSRMVGGFGLMAAGTLMLFLPGPGILTIVAGLALLARDVAWAGRLAEWMKAKLLAPQERGSAALEAPSKTLEPGQTD